MIPTRPTIRLVYDRKHQATKSTAKERKAGLVQIEVMHQRKRRYISTGVKVYTDQWRQNHEQHVVGSVYTDQYNNTIAQAMRSVMDAVDRQVADGAIDLATLGQQTIGSTSVADYARSVVEWSTLAESTRKAYRHIIDTMADFPKFSDIAKVTKRDVDAYYMAIVAKKRQTTQKNYISLLHRTFRAALEAGVIASDPSAHVGYPRMHARERARLTDDEVAAIAAAELPAELESARDLFLWQCYTGMAWVDCATLTSDMITTEGGHIYIIRSRQKTGVQYRTMLLKPAAAILAKYGGTLPKLVSYTYHHRLQRIAKAAGITKHVTSHVGRHTFATWALSHGVPIEIVSKMLGHTNIETTQIYAKILAKDVDAQFERLDGLFD